MRIQHRDQPRSKRSGFTLMEVLVVVAILVILAGTASIFVFRYLEDANTNRAQADLRTLTAACTAYKIRNGDFPESLMELWQPSDGSTKPYVESEAALLDPWRKPYQYDPTGPNNGGRNPDIWTTTPDGQVIGNWEMVRQR